MTLNACVSDAMGFTGRTNQACNVFYIREHRTHIIDLILLN